MNRFWLAFFWLTGCVSLLEAAPDMITEHYTTENGLPHKIVNCTVKDAEGWVWFGTWYGLCRFDGAKFKVYNNRDEYYMDIPPRKIQAIVEDKSRNLWVKTIDHKLYLFDKRKECFYSLWNELKKNFQVSSQIIKIQGTSEGELLLLTKNKDLLKTSSDTTGAISLELLHHSQNKNRHYELKNNLLCETQDYLSWIGKDYKLISCPKGEELRRKPENFILQQIAGEKKLEFTCVYADKEYLWVGDDAGQVWKINSRNGNTERIVFSPDNLPIRNIACSPHYLYAQVEGKGFYEYHLQSRTFHKIELPVRGREITDIFFDSYDKVWLECGAEQLVYYDPLNKVVRNFAFSGEKILKQFKVQDGRENGFFILTPAGKVYLFDRDRLNVYPFSQSRQFSEGGKEVHFWDILLDPDGILWLSSVDAGVYRVLFPKQQFQLYFPETHLQKQGRSQHVKALFQSRNGDLWLGTRSSDVYRLGRDKQVKQIFSSQNYQIGAVYHIMEDRRGNLWFSTKGDGLVKAEPDTRVPYGFRFTRYLSEEQPRSISGNNIYFTFQDSRGRIWVGTYGGGLNLIEEKEGQVNFLHKYNCFKHYPQYGLYMDIRNITEDANGRIWIGTTDGLISFDGNFTSPEKIEFEVYRKEFEATNVADNDIYALYRDEDSQIWVSVFGGGLNKLVGYDAERKMPVFKPYSLKEGLASDVVYSITGDDEGNLWLATENGIARFNRKTETFRNFDKYDGLPAVRLEEECALVCASGEIWFGCDNGVLTFQPADLKNYNSQYGTYIVDFKVSNRDIRSFRNKPLLTGSIKDTRELTLAYNQSMFTLEYAALNYYNQNRLSYRYILEGYEKEWHLNGKNRIASYINVPPGEYTFRVQAIDEADPEHPAERTLQITILPPWWRTRLAYFVYFLISLVLIVAIVRLVFFMIKIKNDLYIDQKLAELKIKFFTNISHELRTPLTLIKGPLQELKDKEQLSEKGNQYVELMEKNTNQMLQLVNQILDFRKIENGKMRLHISKVDLNALVNSLYREFRLLAEEKEISFTWEQKNENLFLWVDKEKLEIVIRNILSNAFKFTPAGGSIYMSIGSTEDGKCYIRVEDTGVGIPQNKLSEIFERFSQGENAKNAVYPGTGIGLALAKEIISLHQGEITVESKLQKGSVFTVLLQTGKEQYDPAKVNFYVGDVVDETSVENPEAPVRSEEEEGEKEHSFQDSLLLVEDNKDLCRLIQLQLEDKFKVYVAHNGVEGLKKVHLYHPDIVVTDQMMPEMDGLQMLEQIRKDFQVSHIPVVILTAKNDEEAKTYAISKGANAYITKPFSKDYLLARVEQLLSERKLFRENVWKAGTESDSKTDYEQYLVKKDVELLDKIHKIIEENLENSDFNIDTIAANIGLSRSAFFKKLKSLTGLAPVDLVKEIRLNKSVELIKNTDMTITEIAFAVGFKDSGYYSKCFRKKYMQTPREYMSEYRKRADG